MIEETPMIDKRIATYLVELVLEQEKMDEYWRNPKEALEKSGLTPAQQRILLEGGQPADQADARDHSAILKAMHREYVDSPQPLVGEFFPWPWKPPGAGQS